MDDNSLKDLHNLSRDELEKMVLELRKKIDELLNPPPNDWHSWFYAQLMITLHRFFPAVTVYREVPLGAQPPRADFVVVENGDIIDLGLPIFKIFRKYNLLEFKSPDDELSKSVLWKVVGYAGFYISQHEEQISSGDVTLTLVRSTKPRKLLKDMAKFIRNDEANGIYHIKGWEVAFPIQIVVTSELEGKEYAGFRAISKRPELDDIRQMLENGEKETDSFTLDQYRAFFEMLAKLDSDQVAEAKRRFPEMAKTWRDVFKPEIDEWIQEDREITTRNNLFLYVSEGGMPVDYAAKRAGLSPDVFTTKMQEAGYSLPQSA